MGLRDRLETKVTTRTIAVLQRLIPEHEPAGVSVPCHVVSENHAGVHAALPGTDQALLFHRCQRSWWSRMVPAGIAADPDALLYSMDVIKFDAYPIMKMDSGPELAATRLAALITSYRAEMDRL